MLFCGKCITAPHGVILMMKMKKTASVDISLPAPVRSRKLCLIGLHHTNSAVCYRLGTTDDNNVATIILHKFPAPSLRKNMSFMFLVMQKKLQLLSIDPSRPLHDTVRTI